MKPSLRRRARSTASAAEQGVPHLVFRVSGEDYALRLSGVREIVGLGGVARVPEPPAALRGLLDLRGEPIAVVDLASAFGGRMGPDTPESCALVVAGPVEAGQRRAGLAVDGVSGVSSIAPGQMAAAPRLGLLIDARLLTAVARVDERLVPILDLDQLLASADVRAAVATRSAGAARPEVLG